MKTNLLHTGILLLTITTGALRVQAQTDGAPPTAAEQSVIERLRLARAAADGGAPITPAPTADTSAAIAPASGVTAPPDTNAIAATGTNATPEPPAPVAANVPTAPGRPGSPPPTLNAFDLIWQRNIFDPNRQPYQAGRGFVQTQVVRQPRKVETLRFCGTVEKIGKGIDALFTGDGAPESGVLDVGDPVNGLKIAAISNNSVTLVDPNNTTNSTFVLSTENGGRNALTRGDGGPWRATYVSTVFAQAYRPAPSMDNTIYTGTVMQSDPFTFNPGATAFDTGGGYPQTQFGGGGGGRPRGQTRRGGGGAGGAGGGFGGGADTGGGGGGFVGFGAQATVTAAPAAPADPAVLQRLQQRRAQENQ